MAEPSENRTLYYQGKRYARRVKRRLGSTWDAKTAVTEIAKEDGEGVKEVRTAYDFACQVDAIARVVPRALGTILDGENPHLTPSIVAQLAKTSETRITTAVSQAIAGLHPLAPEPPVELSPDRSLWHYDLTRLHEAVTLLQRVEQVVARPGRALRIHELDDLALHATAVRVGTDALRLVLGPGTRGTRSTPVSSASGDRADVVKLAKKARGLIEAVTGDLLRAAHTRSLDAVRDELSRAVCAAVSVAKRVGSALPARVASVPPPGVRRTPGGPYDTGGTYVVVLQVDLPGVVRLGSLGTFWFPAGHLLYVGSAFMAGGVAGRTDRHLDGSGPRLWGVDYLRGFASRTELWWTHHDEKVECRWAMALAGTPQCCCTAPLAGASDCGRCPAHLFFTAERPSVESFARRLGRCGSGGYTIHCQLASQALGGANRVKLRPSRNGEVDRFNPFG
ncbi:MAG: hypothetical protein C0467_26015 [Planctomycetaceae bacterium]|nr:hypothetical protein [Planctomycetaceae bacterium]